MGSPRSAPERGAPLSERRSLGDRLRERLAGRPDSEHEQALIRVGFAVVIVVLIPLLVASAGDPKAVLGCVAIAGAALVGASLVVAHLLWRPAANIARRYVGMTIDVLGITSLMLVGGIATAALYPVLLWIIFGHGFRYGRKPLFVAAGASILGFGAVILLNAEWRSVATLDIALLIALIVLPAYVSALLSKLHDAVARAEAANSAKGRFLAVMSHEFRTPLNAIIGTSDLLGDTPLAADQREMTTTVRTAAHGLLGLVNDVLDFAQIEARQFRIEHEPFDLHATLANVRTTLHQQAVAKGLTLRLGVDPTLPYRLVGASAALRQIMVNLVANAIKFTADGSVTLGVALAGEDEDKIVARITVTDTGIGIAANAQERIFESFAQAEATTNRVYGGTGLGLSIARELTEMMQGRIGVASTPGQGAMFWVELPLARDLDAPTETLGGDVLLMLGDAAPGRIADRIRALGPTVTVAQGLAAHARAGNGSSALLVAGSLGQQAVASAAGATEAIGAAEPIGIGVPWAPGSVNWLAHATDDVSDGWLHTALHAAFAFERSPTSQGSPIRRSERPAHLLVAEDNRTNQKVIGRILERAGHSVVFAANGQEAVERIEEERFDLVLMDVNMPGMGGLEAMKFLRFMGGDDELPPIVVLSADVTVETRKACSEAGFKAYLTKPVETVLLLDTIDRLVAGALVGPDVPLLPDSEPAPSFVPVLEPGKLQSLAALDDSDSFIIGLIEDFIVDAYGLLDEIDAAAARGETRALRDLAHALRSSAAHLGARRLFEHCLAWRLLDDRTLAQRGEAEAALVRGEFEQLRMALNAFLDRITQRSTAPVAN